MITKTGIEDTTPLYAGPNASDNVVIANTMTAARAALTGISHTGVFPVNAPGLAPGKITVRVRMMRSETSDVKPSPAQAGLMNIAGMAYAASPNTVAMIQLK